MALLGSRCRLSGLSRRLLSTRAASSVGSNSYGASRRSFSSDSEEEKIITATLFPGDGIGPEIAVSVKEVRGGVRSFFPEFAMLQFGFQ